MWIYRRFKSILYQIRRFKAHWLMMSAMVFLRNLYFTNESHNILIKCVVARHSQIGQWPNFLCWRLNKNVIKTMTVIWTCKIVIPENVDRKRKSHDAHKLKHPKIEFDTLKCPFLIDFLLHREIFTWKLLAVSLQRKWWQLLLLH